MFALIDTITVIAMMVVIFVWFKMSVQTYKYNEIADNSVFMFTSMIAALSIYSAIQNYFQT